LREGKVLVREEDGGLKPNLVMRTGAELSTDFAVYPHFDMNTEMAASE
jgi:hypothetical protein